MVPLGAFERRNVSTFTKTGNGKLIVSSLMNSSIASQKHGNDDNAKHAKDDNVPYKTLIKRE